MIYRTMSGVLSPGWMQPRRSFEVVAMPRLRTRSETREPVRHPPVPREAGPCQSGHAQAP
jgi:hypothetical protein